MLDNPGWNGWKGENAASRAGTGYQHVVIMESAVYCNCVRPVTFYCRVDSTTPNHDLPFLGLEGYLPITNPLR